MYILLLVFFDPASRPARPRRLGVNALTRTPRTPAGRPVRGVCTISKREHAILLLLYNNTGGARFSKISPLYFLVFTTFFSSWQIIYIYIYND